MKKLVSAFLLGGLLATTGWVEGTVTSLSPPTQVEGSLAHGQKIPLEWAESSAVACFPATRFEQFDGHHVFYRIAMPAASKMQIILTPKAGAKINLYALRQPAAGQQPVPPNVSSAISAEASYPMYARKAGGKIVTNADDGVRKVEFISIDQPYSILVGVAGAQGLSQGEFTLSVSLQSRH